MLSPELWNRSVSSNVWNSSTEAWNSSSSMDIPADTVSSVYAHPLYKVSQYIWGVGSPVILLVGNFGNVMTIIIMRRQSSGEAVVNVYFTSLAIVDLVILNFMLVDEWVGMAFGYYIHVQNLFICKLRNWTGVTTTVMAAWFLASLTAHRAMSVVWPHRVNALCTRRMAAGTLAALAIVAGAVHSHYLFGYELRYFDKTEEYICIMAPGSFATFVQDVFTYIYLTIYCLLPFSCIIVANSVLVWKLRATIREVRGKVAEKKSVAAREKAARSVTVTIITVSAAFVLLTLPVSVYFISLFIFDHSASMSVREHAMGYVIRAVVFMVMFCNSAINFYLYCLTGARFRKAFVSIFCSGSLRNNAS